MMPKRPGIHDVAKAADVSITTVSHALSGRGQVSEATKARVRLAAEELGYSPNRIASALRSNRSGLIGLVSDEIATTPFAGRLVLGAQDEARAQGMLLLLVSSGRDAAIQSDQIRALRAQQVDGIILATMFHRRIDLPAEVAGIPTVVADAVPLHGGAPAIAPDEVRIGRTAARRLLDAGHTSLAHLTISDRGEAHDGRARGFSEEVAAAGLVPLIVEARGEHADAAAGRRAFEAAIGRNSSLSAVACFNDQMAMGVYQVATRLGILVPTSLSVIGVDDFEPVAAALIPGLTTVALPHYEMGRWAVQRLADVLNGTDVPNDTVYWPSELIERDSVAAPSRSRDA